MSSLRLTSSRFFVNSLIVAAVIDGAAACPLIVADQMKGDAKHNESATECRCALGLSKHMQVLQHGCLKPPL